MDSKKKKIIIAAIIGVLLVGIIAANVFSFAGVNKNKGSVAAVQGKSVFYMYDKLNSDIYTLNENKEKTKIVSDAQFISYKDQLNSYLMVDKDNALYTVDDKGNKDKISSDAAIGKIKAGAESKVYFITKNSDLYLKEKDKEKEKIASNVSDFLVAGTSVVFSDNENSFFMKKVGKDKIKLASNVENFRFNFGLNMVAYVSEGALYLKNIEKDEKDKLSDKNNSAPFEFASDTALVYMEDYDIANKKGELFYKEQGKDKRKLASDVSRINVFSDGIFYVNSDKTLYFREYKGEKNTKILDDVTETITSNGYIFALDKDKNLYKVNGKGEKEKLNQDVIKHEETIDSIASTNKEKELYVGNKKIASDVVDFSVNGKEIAYINTSNEVYIVKDSVTSEKIIDNAKEYKKIQFNDYMLFTNTLGSGDIAGCWKGSNKVNGVVMYFKFDGNNSISNFSFKDLETSRQYKIENPTENSLYAKIDNESAKIEKVDNDTLKISFNNSGENLKRISEEEYNKNKSIVDKIYPKAKELYKEFTAFEGIEEISGKTYYKYASDEGDIGSLIYFDVDGNMFSMRQSKLVPYGTPIESNTKSNNSTNAFTKDVALKYMKDYYIHKNGNDSGVNYMAGDLGHEGARSYYKIKLISIAAVKQGGSGSMGWFKVFEDGSVIQD